MPGQSSLAGEPGYYLPNLIFLKKCPIASEIRFRTWNFDPFFAKLNLFQKFVQLRPKFIFERGILIHCLCIKDGVSYLFAHLLNVKTDWWISSLYSSCSSSWLPEWIIDIYQRIFFHLEVTRNTRRQAAGVWETCGRTHKTPMEPHIRACFFL